MLNLKVKIMVAVWISLACGATLSAVSLVNAEEPETLSAWTPSEATHVNYVNVEKILEADYIREALEDILEKDLPDIYRGLTEYDLEMDGIFKEAFFFSNHGDTSADSEIGGIIIKTDVTPKLFEKILNA